MELRDKSFRSISSNRLVNLQQSESEFFLILKNN